MTGKLNGFTLLELAVVLLIIGLLLAGLFTPVAISIEQERRETLSRQYDQIREALMGFIIINGRLPCPDCSNTATGTCGPGDEDDGIEDIETGTCKADTANLAVGNLPWVDLGVAGRDPWGEILAYQVQTDHADATDGTGEVECITREQVSFQICSKAGFTVKDAGETCGGTSANVATEVPAVVYSQGNHAATSCHELENTDGDEIFVSRGYSADQTDYYDDMILWLSPKVLISRMVQAEVLP